MTPMNAEERGYYVKTRGLVFSAASSVLVRVLLLALVASSVASCSPQTTPTIFIPPTAEVLPTTASPSSSATPAPTATATSTMTPVVVTPTPCTNDLKFVQDVTVPDGTSVTPGEPVDKQWLVTNAGTCNWDASYRLKLVTGDEMGVSPEQDLYPARAGTQATLRIVFTAPQTSGNYTTAWQAFAPDGTAFGERLTMQINVAP